MNESIRRKSLAERVQYVERASQVIQRFENELANTRTQLDKLMKLSDEQLDSIEQEYFEKTGNIRSLREVQAEMVEKCQALSDYIEGFNGVLKDILKEGVDDIEDKLLNE